MALLIEAQHLEPYDSLTSKVTSGIGKGKTVLVTGGGYGIGSAIAKSFAQAGAAEIILVGRTQSRLLATAQELARFKKTKFSYFAVDISNEDDVRKVFQTLRSSPDVLVNNAGYMATPATFVDANLQDYWKAFTINVYGTALLTQSFLAHRKEIGSSSAAVVITLNTIGAYSVRGPNLSSYGASKAALARMMELIAVDVPESTARFISVHPGAVKTDMGIKSGLDGVFPNTNPQLTGDFITWTATDEASFLNGRFVWVNWDVDELLRSKEAIIRDDLFRTTILGA